MNNTPNINLSTYTSDPNDKFNLLVTFNNNMTKIDTAVGAQNDAIDVIEATAGTAVSTANTASATATEALTTANTASNTANTALTTANSKASIDDLVSSATTTYSSDKINELISGVGEGFPDYGNKTVVATDSTSGSTALNVSYTASEDCYLYVKADFTPTSSGIVDIQLFTSGRSASFPLQFENHFYVGLSSPLYKVKSGTEISAIINYLNTTSNNELNIYKIPIIN